MPASDPAGTHGRAAVWAAELVGVCGVANMSAYRDHLDSDLWKRIRSDAAARSQGLCELCKSVAKEAHHVKYPRGYANDSADNVLHVCSACHRRLHGMNDLTVDHTLTPAQAAIGPRSVGGIYVDERGWIWASVKAWEDALRMPPTIKARLFSSLAQRAGVLKERRGESFAMSDPNGETWYRWAAVSDALTGWYYRTERRIADKDRSLTDDETYLHANADKLIAWGASLQESALRGAATSGRAIAPAADGNAAALAQAMALLAGVAQKHEESIQEHDGRITRIESRVVRDPKQFISARAFLLEVGRDADEQVPGMNIGLGAWIGTYLTKQGAPLGPKARWRLPNSSRVEQVNTYRRVDLEYALKKAPTK